MVCCKAAAKTLCTYILRLRARYDDGATNKMCVNDDTVSSANTERGPSVLQDGSAAAWCHVHVAVAVAVFGGDGTSSVAAVVSR